MELVATVSWLIPEEGLIIADAHVVGGPERFDQSTGKVAGARPVTQRFDIWSLACVLLEAATWVILGVRGVDQFRIARKRAHRRNSSNDNRGDDCFHQLGHVSFVTGDWIERLKHAIRSEDRVSGEILDIIKDQMLLVEPHRRKDSEALGRLFKSTLQSCEDNLKALPKYTLPGHFQPAFEEEQESAAKDWEDPQSRAPSAKLMLSRSVRFPQPGKKLLDQPVGQPYANPRTSGSHLRVAIGRALQIDTHHHGVQPLYHNQHLTPDNDNDGAQSSYWASTTASPASPLSNRSPVLTPTRGSASTFPPPQEERQLKFDYYDALDLLIGNRGWVYSSLLELPGSCVNPPDRNDVRPLRDDGPSNKTEETSEKASAWSKFTSNASIKKGEKKSGYSSAIAQAFHSITRSKRNSRAKTSTPRLATIPGNRPSAGPVQALPRDRPFGDLFNDRDIVSLGLFC